ncbi:DJ-1/PfpI family protein [uncultured Croceitalea sp.]|uniref:DJ-1/PfpI family protein n=1 Tax=uncultured Croceitalea sp. TaxID=1798908 RepID=UPI0033059072
MKQNYNCSKFLLKHYLAFLYMLFPILGIKGQIKDTLNVALFLYEGVELLDFSGPGEVMAAASYYTDVYHFNVYTVAKEKELTSQGFLKITPNYDLNNAPKTDILILPGGFAGESINDVKTQEWMNSQLDKTSHVLTVCSGVYFLENPGKLNDIKITSHHKIIPFLKESLGAENVMEDVKYVDSGKIITSAGVSSGIEGALWTVARIAGYEVANRTARYMEYPQWNFSVGHTTYDLMSKTDNYLKPGNKEIPDFGILDVAGHLAYEKGNSAAALKYFEKNKEYYPKSALTYYGLSQALKNAKEWTPDTYEDFLNVLRNDTAKAQKMYERAKEAYPDWILFTVKDITVRGYNLQSLERFKEAETVFQMGLETYPNDLELTVQLIKIQEKLGNRNEALKTLKKALEALPRQKELLQLEQTINSK